MELKVEPISGGGGRHVKGVRCVDIGGTLRFEVLCVDLKCLTEVFSGFELLGLLTA